MNETAQETTAVTATLVEHESEVLPALAEGKKKNYIFILIPLPYMLGWTLAVGSRPKRMLAWNGVRNHIDMYFTASVFV